MFDKLKSRGKPIELYVEYTCNPWTQDWIKNQYTNQKTTMLYSHNLEDEKINLFSLFLTKAIQGEHSYAPIVNDVILETHKFVAGEKNLYNIKRDSMNIILLLASLEKDYFMNLSDVPDKYNVEIYAKVLNLLKLPKPHLAY